MSDVFRGDDQNDRKDDQDRLRVKFCQLEIRHGEDRRRYYRREIHDSAADSSHIARDHSDQDRDNGKKAAEDDGSENSNAKRYEEHDHIFRLNRFVQKPCILRSASRQLQADQRHHRPHRRRRQNHIDPVGTELIDNRSQNTAAEAYHHETAQRIFISHLADDNSRRRQESKAGTQISRRLSLCYRNVQKRTEAVHEQNDRRINAEHKGHQNTGAEHGQQMLDGQRDQQINRNLFVHLNDSFVFH